MEYELSNQVTLLKALITKDEAKQAKEIAKSKGMTFQGWLGNVIRQELQKEERA